MNSDEAIEAGAKAWFNRVQSERRGVDGKRPDGLRWQWEDIFESDRVAYRALVRPIVVAMRIDGSIERLEAHAPCEHGALADMLASEERALARARSAEMERDALREVIGEYMHKFGGSVPPYYRRRIRSVMAGGGRRDGYRCPDGCFNCGALCECVCHA